MLKYTYNGIIENYPPYVGKLSFAPNVPRRIYSLRVCGIMTVSISTREIFL